MNQLGKAGLTERKPIRCFSVDKEYTRVTLIEIKEMTVTIGQETH